ncbi:hypothetical protein ACP4OV_014895 [Aristida adscensionis]
MKLVVVTVVVIAVAAMAAAGAPASMAMPTGSPPPCPPCPGTSSMPSLRGIWPLLLPGASSSPSAPAANECPPCRGRGPQRPPPTECVTALWIMSSCGNYLQGNAPTPGSACCDGFAQFLEESGAGAAVADGGFDELRCLCPVITGEVNMLLATPVDPARMEQLPVACGVVLPPAAVTACFDDLAHREP